MDSLRDGWKKPAGKKRACYFSAEFLMGRLVNSNLMNLGLLRGSGPLPEGARQERGRLRADRGRRARQRRTGQARGLLPRFRRDPRHPARRLRHPLPLRALPPVFRGRLPAGARRRLAALRRPVERAPGGGRGRGALRRPDGARRALRHAGDRLRRKDDQHPAPLAVGTPLRLRFRPLQPPGVRPRGRRKEPCRGDLLRPLPQRRHRRGASACA